MIYAYIRVSTDKQTVENQRFEIEKFARIRELNIDKWISETVSGTKSAKKRKLGSLIKKLKKGDTLIASEISRLGRRLMEVMSILNTLMQKNITVFTVKEKYELAPVFFKQNAGCQMNSLQTDTVAGIVKRMGYTEVSREEDADVVIYNTCTVRENANQKIYGHLGHLKSIKRNHPDMKIVLFG